MKNFIYFLLLLITQSCGVYSFSGGDVGNAKTFQVSYFLNNANLVEPSLSQKFTLALQDMFLQQTNLNSVSNNADLTFEGEITQYRIMPIAATASQTAEQSRLTIAVKVRFYNVLEEEKNFDKSFTHFFDYNGSDILIGSKLDEAFKVIFERITQDIFNASVAQW
ncbi:MAG: LPS assembly lipoprotein LptE [Flavobacteriaceae bacterium]|nr:LPS assembly lipoprotein LptE [Flavobacteriaceae bacterium]